MAKIINTMIIAVKVDFCLLEFTKTAQDDFMTLEHFPQYWPFAREMHWLLIFLLLAWTNCCL